MIVMRSTHQQDAACADLAQIEYMLRDNVERVSAQLDRICHQVDGITAVVDGIHRDLQHITADTQVIHTKVKSVAAVAPEIKQEHRRSFMTIDRWAMAAYEVRRRPTPRAPRTLLDPIDLPPSWLYQDGIAGFRQE